MVYHALVTKRLIADQKFQLVLMLERGSLGGQRQKENQMQSIRDQRPDPIAMFLLQLNFWNEREHSSTLELPDPAHSTGCPAPLRAP
jgi:hypothetical protein